MDWKNRDPPDRDRTPVIVPASATLCKPPFAKRANRNKFRLALLIPPACGIETDPIPNRCLLPPERKSIAELSEESLRRGGQQSMDPSGRRAIPAIAGDERWRSWR